MKRNERGFAKVEFLANIAKIRDLVSKGYSKKAVYRKLKDAGSLSVSYSHFCRFDLSGNISKKDDFTPGVPTSRTVSALIPAIPAENSGDGSITQQANSNSKFVHENNVTEKDLAEKLVG
ncbi:TraK family protein [Maridesulfovibrio ferrireducens]|uniref:TraK family protein n=1 Tax=Maridesulfovibrio ferrireducens TaxID=246191 RepID=UPI001A2C911D|nr:TraK family protein [Maridesulfovibrio ferrireducens]MBI9112330.1 hypothetical protein [Maridesulfovibrio ferrireducens]